MKILFFGGNRYFGKTILNLLSRNKKNLIYLVNRANKKNFLKKNIRIVHVKDRAGHDFRYSLNSSKLKKKIKWKIKTNFVNGLVKTFDWYFKNQNFFKEFKKSDINRRIG